MSKGKPPPPLPPKSPHLRRSLTQKKQKKTVPFHSFPKKARGTPRVGGGRFATGGWWRLVAVGGWRLMVPWGGP